MQKLNYFTQSPRKKAGRIATPSIVTLVRNIETVLAAAQPKEVEYGLIWYQDAHKYARFLGDPNKTSQVLSILSAQVDWTTNQVNALKLIKGGESVRIFASKKQKREAYAASKGTFRIPKTALKTYAFAATIANPDTFEGVVIDRHAIAIAFGYLKASEVSVTASRYRKLSEAYTIVAKRHGLKPHQVQAITWVTYKRIVGR